MHEWPVGATLQLWCTGFSLQRLPLLSTGPRVQEFSHCTPLGAIVVVHGLGCSMACGIFPDQGSNRVSCTGR